MKIQEGVSRQVAKSILSLVAIIELGLTLFAEEVVFKPGDTGSSYIYYPMNESSKKSWWVDEKNLDAHAGADVTFWGEQDQGVYPGHVKRAESNWIRNVGAVKGDNTWIWEFFQPTDSVGSMEIGDARGFFGWWRFLKPITVKFPRATGAFEPALQRVESVGRAKFEVASADGRVVVSNLIGSGVVQKVGPGDLEVVRTGGSYVNVAHHAGTLTLHEQEKGESVTFASVLARAKIHFDASDKDRFVLDDEGRVTKWNASEPNTQYYAQPITTNKYDMGAPMFTYKYREEVLPKPVYREGYSSTGLAVVDFGPFRKYDDADATTCGASALEFMRSGARVNYVEAFIVFGDADPQCRCDVFCDSHNRTFARGTGFRNFDDSKNFFNMSGGILDTAAATRLSRDIRVNGRLVPPWFALAGSNLKVVSIDCRKQGNVQSGESVMGAFARRSNTEFGGQIVAEFIGFNESLTDAERQAVNRHLMEKWLGADDCDATSVNTVEVDHGGEISVPAGETATVNHLYATASATTVVKTGEGTLGVVDLSASGGKGVSIDVRAGTVAFKAPSAALSDDPQVASSPRYHFDASKLDSLTTNVVGATTYVTRWDDVGQPNVYAYPVTDEFDLKATTNTPAVATRPALPQLEMGKCNGLPVIYLGERTDVNGIKKAGYGTAAAFLYTKRAEEDSTTLANVMEGFAVIEGGYCRYPFSTMSRRIFAPSGWNLISGRLGAQALTGGAWTIDGEPVDPAAVTLNNYRGRSLANDYFVVRFSANERVWIDGLGFDGKLTEGVGGLRVGEVVLYDRRLNEMERRNTEAALMRKWLGREHPHKAGPQVENLRFSADSKATLETDVDLSVRNLESARSSFVKAGNGTLTAALPSAVIELTVSAGGYEIQTPAEMAMASALLHLDASVASSLEYDGSDSTKIVRWNDVRGAGHHYAERNAARYSGYATLLADAQNGFPAVDFGDTTTWGVAEGDKTEYNNYPNTGKALCFDEKLNVREGFLVLRCDSQSPILGGWDDTSFHPDNTHIMNVNSTVDHSLSCLKRQTEWRVDDAEIDIWTYTWTTFRSTGTGYHVLSFAITNDYSTVSSRINCAPVQNLCADRAHESGGKKYGEVVLFDRSLTAAERAAVRQHLVRKWNTAEIASETPRTLSKLVLGAGASVTLGPIAAVNAFSGEGTVEGALTFAENAEIRAAYRGADDYTQTVVDGTLTLPSRANVTLTVETATKPENGSFIDLVVAQEIVGNCAAWRDVSLIDIDGNPYGRRSVALSVVTRPDGKKALRATFVAHGVMIIVR